MLTQDYLLQQIPESKVTAVWVFTTSVRSKDEVSLLEEALNCLAGAGQWNFDLDDCDRILRVVSGDINPMTIVHLLRHQGFECRELPD
jgi:hypothetical protein